MNIKNSYRDQKLIYKGITMNINGEDSATIKPTHENSLARKKLNTVLKQK